MSQLTDEMEVPDVTIPEMPGSEIPIKTPSPMLTLDGADKITPDKAYNSVNLADRLKIPENLALDSLQEYQKRHLSDFISQNYKYASWVTESDINAAIAKDDPDNLAALFSRLSGSEIEGWKAQFPAPPAPLSAIEAGALAFDAGARQIAASLIGGTSLFFWEGVQKLSRPFLEEDLEDGGTDYIQQIIDANPDMRKMITGDVVDEFKAYRSRVQSPVGGFALDVINQSPQFIGAGGSYAMAKSAMGVAAFMGSYIFGDTYVDLREAGVPPEKAASWSLFNAAAQSALEAYGMHQLFAPLKPGRSAALGLFKGMGTEFGTEFLQKFPEDFSRAMAKNRTLTGGLNQFSAGIGETFKEGLYEALLSVPFAILGGAGKMAYDYKRIKAADAWVQRQMEISEALEKTKLKQSSPSKTVQLLESGNMTQEVVLDAAELKKTMYETAFSIEKLDLTAAQINEAAAMGQGVTVKLSHVQGLLTKEEKAKIFDIIKRNPLEFTLKEAKAAKEAINEELGELSKAYDRHKAQDSKFKKALLDLKNQMIKAVNDNPGAKAQTEAEHGSVENYVNGAIKLWERFAETNAGEAEKIKVLQRVAVQSGLLRRLSSVPQTEPVPLEENPDMPETGNAPLPDLQTLETHTEQEYAKLLADEANEEYETAKRAQQAAVIQSLKGKIAGASLKKTWPQAYNEIKGNFGVKFFKSKKKGGQSVDVVVQELQAAGQLGEEVTADDVVEMLKAGKQNQVFFQVNEDGNAVAPGEQNPRIAKVVVVDPAKIVDENGKPVDLKNTAALRKWAIKQYQGRTIRIEDDGKLVLFGRDGIEASAKKRGNKQRQAYADIDTAIENAIHDSFMETDVRHPRVEGQEVYYGAAQIGGKYYGIRFKLDKVKADKKLHYKDHKVSKIEIAPALSAAQSIQDGGQPPAANAIHGISLSVLKGEVNPSRIENGILYQTGRDPIAERADVILADEALRRDVEAWGESVDALEKAAKSLQRENDPFMRQNMTMLQQTPLVMQMVGAKNLPVEISPGKLEKARKDHDLSYELIKQIPRAMADPIMIFQSASQGGDIVLMLNLKDQHGGTIVVPVGLELLGTSGYMANIATSVYGKTNDKTLKPNNAWFGEQIRNGDLRYQNKKKSRDWARTSRLQLPGANSRTNSAKQKIYTEDDLVKLREQNPTMYHGRQTGPRGSLTIRPNGSGYDITINENANLSTLLHESGHVFLEELRRLVNEGKADERTIGILADAEKWMGQGLIDIKEIKTQYNKYLRNTPLFAGVTYNRLSAEQKLDAIEKLKHERFARAFEAYLREGKAPVPELKSIFARFAAWLKKIYTETLKLGVELNPEISSVFDRMLATDLELEQAAAYNELYEFTEQMLDNLGVTDSDRVYINGLLAAGKEKAADEINRDATKEKDVLVRQWAKEAEKIIADDPVYQIRDKLHSRGKTGKHSLNYALLEEAVGEKQAKALSRALPGSVTAEGKLDPNIFANENSYKNAAEMVEALAKAEPKKKPIDRYVQAQSLEHEKSRDVSTKLLEQSAIKERLEFTGKYIAAALKRKPVGQKVIEDVASSRIVTMPLKEAMLPKHFEADMRRALARERRAIAVGDFKAAFEANQQARLNLEFASQARVLAKDVNSIIKKANAFVGMKKADPNARYLVMETGSRYGFIKPDPRLADGKNLETAEHWVNDRIAEGAILYLNPAVLAGSIHYTQLSWKKFWEVSSNINQIIATERNLRKLLTEQGKMDYDAAINKSVEVIHANNKIAPHKKVEKPGILKRAFDSITAAHQKVEFMLEKLDGGPVGFIHSLVYMPLNSAENKRGAMWKALNERLNGADVFGLYTEKELKLMGQQKIFVKEIGESLTKEQLIMFGLNSGNEGNYDRLQAGFDYTDEQIQAVLAHLDSRDWKFIQAIWDTFAGYKDEAFKLEEEMAGLKPFGVEARPFEIKTADGQTITVKGGYFPIAYDNEKARPDFADKIMQGRGPIYSMTTPGHLQDRQAQGAGTPLLLRMSVIPGSLRDLVTDIAFRKPYNNVAKVVRSNRFRTAVEGALGAASYQSMVKWLKDAPGERGATEQFGTLMRWARTGATQMSMGYKLTTLLNQPLGLLQAMDVIGLKYTAIGMQEMYGKGMGKMLENMRWIREISQEMDQRMNNYDRDATDAIRQMEKSAVTPGNILDAVTPAALLSVEKKFQKYGLRCIGGMQYYTVDLPVFLGAYHKGLADFKGDTEKARDYAESVVRMTQGGGRNLEPAGVQIGGEFARLLTMFYSYFNVLYTLTSKRTHDVNMNRDLPSVMRAANSFLFLFIIPAIAGELIAMRGPDDDDEWWKWSARKIISYPMQTMAGVRTLASTIEGYGYKVTPASDTPAYIVKFVTSAWKFLFDENTKITGTQVARRLFQAYGYAKGLLLGQAEISAFNVADYLSGTDEDMELLDLFYRKRK
ncbi:MAG: hypothetical protein LBM00_02970 [Deltaproteobacteria bacterium]|jgi:hypothetical protein|nr:hypothetical protein [Deltaproteobacteria bacterium]